VATKITHPGQLQGGFAYTGMKNWLARGRLCVHRLEVVQEPCRSHSPVPAPSDTLIANYNNSSSLRLGAEYTIPTDGWKLRAGFVGAASAAPPETVDPLLPEQDRYYWNFGVGIPLWNRLTVDGTYSRVNTEGQRGRTVIRTNTALTADQVNSGVYTLTANIFSITLKASF